MAYSNWGAIVYRNGERIHSHEDMAFGVDVYHAVLGDGPVRLCGYKHIPVLYLGDESVPMEEYASGPIDEGEYNPPVSGNVDGYEFTATPHSGNMIDLYLREPDGTVWTSTCGFEYGAGWE